jgi:hypothetical protein
MTHASTGYATGFILAPLRGYEHASAGYAIGFVLAPLRGYELRICFSLILKIEFTGALKRCATHKRSLCGQGEVGCAHAGMLAHRATGRQTFPANQSVVFTERESALFASSESWIPTLDLADASATHQELAPAFCSNFDGHVCLQ